MDQAGPYSVLAFSGAAVRAQAIEIMYMAVQAEPVLFRQFALQFFNALIADFHDLPQERQTMWSWWLSGRATS